MQRSNSIRSHRSMRRSASMRARLDAELAAQTTLTTAETRHLRQLYDAGNFPSHFASAREFELYILSNFGVSVDARHPGPLQDALKPPGEVPRARAEDGDATENGMNIPFASSGPDAAVNPSGRSGGLSMKGDRGGRHRRDHDGPPVTIVSCDHLLLIMAVVKRASLSDGNDDVARAFRALTDPAFGAPTPTANAFGMRSPLSPTGAASPVGSSSPRFPASGARAGNSHNSSSPSSAASPQSGPLPTDGTFGVDRLRQVANNFGLDVGELMPTLTAAGFGGLTRGGIAGTSSAAMGANRPAPLSSSSALGDEMGFDVFRRMLEVPPSRGGVDSRGEDPFDALAPGAAPAPAQSTAATIRVGRRVDFSSGGGDKKNQPAPVIAATTTSPTTVTPGAGGPTTTSGSPAVDATAVQQLGGSKSLNSSQGGPQQQQQADPFDQWVRDMEYKSHDIQHLLDGVEKRRRRERRRQARLAAGLAGSGGKATTSGGGGLGRSGGGLVMVAEVSSDGSSSSDEDSGELHMYGANARSSPAPARPYPISQSSLPAVQGASGSSPSPQNVNGGSVAPAGLLRPSPAATTTSGPRGHSNTGGVGGVHNNAAAASANDEARRRGFFVERDVGVAVPLPPHPGTERMTRAALMGSLLRSSQKSDANAVKEAARVAAELEARRRSVSERRAQELRVIRGGSEGGANTNGARESPPAGHIVSTSALLANFDPTRFPAGGVPHSRSYTQTVSGGGAYPKSLTPMPGMTTGAGGSSPGSGGSLAAQYATSPDRATSVGAVSMGRNKLTPMPVGGGAVSGPASFGLAPLPQMALRSGLSPNRTKYQF
jgi:hypothetical protein